LKPSVQAEAFARFVRKRFGPDYGREYWSRYGVFLHDPRNSGHWLEVIASLVKMRNTFDSDREKEIRRRLLN
jgi:hypothetical protein